MEFQAIRQLYGDFGAVHPGQRFTVPDTDTAIKRMRQLEAKGLVMRYREPRPRPNPKAIEGYENKMLGAAERKGGPVQPPVKGGAR